MATFWEIAARSFSNFVLIVLCLCVLVLRGEFAFCLLQFLFIAFLLFLLFWGSRVYICGPPKKNEIHYENTPMQYTAIFLGCKNDNFQLKFVYFFHIFAQNIYCGYTLEPPQ